MKILPAHYEHLRAAIAEVWTPARHYEITAAVTAEGRAKDIRKRVRWDWFAIAGLVRFTCEELYGYLDDSHIDTALRRIVRELEEGELPYPAN